MRRLTLAAAALIALLSPAFADDGCGKFAWPLTREQTLLAASDKASVNAGAILTAIPKTAFVVHLQPGAQAVSPCRPSASRGRSTGSAARSGFPAWKNPAFIK